MQRRFVRWASQPSSAELPLRLFCGTEREVENLDRMPGPQRVEPRPESVVIASLDPHVGSCTVRHLLMRVKDRPLVAGVRRCSEPDRHAFGEEATVVGAWNEVPPAAADDTV